MIEFAGRAVLLDVEGTTSAVSYVYDVMFPFARTGLESYLEKHARDYPLAIVKDQIARDAGAASFAAWTAGNKDPEETLRDEVLRLMDGDVKATGLKQLQGLIWQAGFESGELRAHVYEDVPPALRKWRESGVDVRIYSSGSVHAQRLFFAHTEAGNLTPLLSGNYDTTTGPKQDAASYTKIAEDWGRDPDDVLFLSDTTEELNAAREAGMQTGLAIRPGNAEATPSDPPHPAIESFAQVSFSAV